MEFWTRFGLVSLLVAAMAPSSSFADGSIAPHPASVQTPGPRPPARFHSALTNFFRELNPRHLWNTARTNYREGRFYATDLSEHSSARSAFKQSIAPTKMSANVGAAIRARGNGTKIFAALFDPLGIELQRQVAAGNGLDTGKLVGAMNPAVIASTFAGTAVGDISGAVVQSTLAQFGPVGAAAGFVARSAMAYSGGLIGMGVGDGVARGHGVKSSLANALREFKPGRDIGQMMGTLAGTTLGQVFIPIPIVGGVIGGMIGATVGAVAGDLLERLPGFRQLSRAIVRTMHRWADQLEGKGKAPDSAAAANSVVVHRGRVTRPAGEGNAPPAARDDSPNSIDIGVATH